MLPYKPKPLLYKLRHFYTEYLCDYNGRFILLSYFNKIKYKIGLYFFPYNVIKIKTLSSHWNDLDQVLLHVNFQILTDFIECELDGKQELVNIEEELNSLKESYNLDQLVKYEANLKKQNENTIELFRLYNWWTVDRPLREKNYPKFPEKNKGIEDKSTPILNEYGDVVAYKYNHVHDPEFSKWALEYHDFEEKCQIEDDENLVKLIKLRSYLWS